MTEPLQSRKRIVIVAPAIGGGASVAGIALRHAHLLSSQFQVHVVTQSVPHDLPAHIGRTIVRPVRWDWLRRFCHVPNELSFAWAARQAIIELQAQGPVDAIWCHGHTIAALVAGPLRSRLGAAVIITVHGNIFERPPGTYTWDLTALYRWATRRTHVVADAIHAISPAIAEAAIEHGAPPAHVHLIAHGIEPETIGLRETHPRIPGEFLVNDTLQLLYVGGLLPIKGLDGLLKAAASHTSHRIELVLAGDGPERSHLEMLARSLGVNAKFLGAVPRQELGARYRRADIVCLPSLSEALPLVILEAMVCGTPVVASNIGGIPSMVADGQNGHLATPGDAVALEQALSRAAASREHLALLGATGWARARKDFSWPAIGKQLEALALTAIDNAPRRRGRG
ncbi:glycosyltransferase family 4 protein [Caenimonas sp. SL110]|uniref:glycosyltransferase family 4 protein n=1 Tax=Caenimonas sp. SL110 TaxID=1450524 RepID=UPI00069E5CA6|nr:glycosyltransferase family 4 protein [Caenimonas sp. SL110]